MKGLETNFVLDQFFCDGCLLFFVEVVLYSHSRQEINFYSTRPISIAQAHSVCSRFFIVCFYLITRNAKKSTRVLEVRFFPSTGLSLCIRLTSVANLSSFVAKSREVRRSGVFLEFVWLRVFLGSRS